MESEYWSNSSQFFDKKAHKISTEDKVTTKKSPLNIDYLIIIKMKHLRLPRKGSNPAVPRISAFWRNDVANICLELCLQLL